MKHFEKVMDVMALRHSAQMHHWMMWAYAAADNYEEAMTSQLLYLADSDAANKAADKMSGQAVDTMIDMLEIAQCGKVSAHGW